MARNKSEKLTSCPEAIAYADAVEEGRLTCVRLGDIWNKIPTSFKGSISHERRSRKAERGLKYFSGITDLSRRDFLINAQIIRERYGS